MKDTIPDYIPDRWAIVKIVSPQTDGKPMYKVLGSWHGGYLGGDSWKLNSGIKQIKKSKDKILFHGFSGSIYQGTKSNYGVSSYSNSVFNHLKKMLLEKYNDAIMELLTKPEALKLKI
jgi:Mor family transcriptional regulator